jgi:hypothetical protein
VLKLLSEAIAGGDPIRAVIRNTSCNHSGKTNGITAPSQKAQEDILTRLHEEVGLRPDETTFVEVRQYLMLTNTAEIHDANSKARVMGPEPRLGKFHPVATKEAAWMLTETIAIPSMLVPSPMLSPKLVLQAVPCISDP